MEIPEDIDREILEFANDEDSLQNRAEIAAAVRIIVRKTIRLERERAAMICCRFGRNLIARHILEVEYKDIAPAPPRLPDDGE